MAMPKAISSELLKEGMAREIVHRIQMMRRAADFNIADYIKCQYQGDEYIEEVFRGYAEYIGQETLSRELIRGAPEGEVFTESYRIGGRELQLWVEKVS